MGLPHAARAAERGLRETANHPWVHTLARAGYATKGAVYILIGTLSLDAALYGTRVVDGTSAVRHVRDLPFGPLLLPIIAVGLFGYGFWRLVQAIFDADHEGKALHGIVKRAGHLFAGIAYGGLAIATLQLALGHGSRGDATRTWIGRLLGEPFGQPLAMAVGAGVVIFGGSQLVSAMTGSFARHWDQFRMTARERRWALQLGRLGLGARGLVFAVVGGLVIKAAVHSNPNEAGGIAAALAQVRAEPHGSLLLAGVATGLACYGLYMVACARFRYLGRV